LSESTILKRTVLGHVLKICESMGHAGPMLNERYLHHCFSHRVQGEGNALDLSSGPGGFSLHPEWPTCKKSTGLACGRYKFVEGRYMPDPAGGAGFIDFALGRYERPDIGVEFSLKHGWSQEEVVFDFLKVMDGKNPFKVGVSGNVILRKGGLSSGKWLERLEERVVGAYEEAVHRLGADVCAGSRELYLLVSEIGRDSERRHWHLERSSGTFARGLPPVP
jgi:hypothetical protein